MSVLSEIRKRKNKLIRKATRSGIYENFGQKEVRELTDMFGRTSEINSFDQWCMTFDLTKLCD